MEAVSSKEEIFSNDLDNDHMNETGEDVDENDFLEGFSNLFIETKSTKEQEMKQTEMCFGFSDELFNEYDKIENECGGHDAISTLRHAKEISDSDLLCTFNLFGDSDDDDDSSNLVSNIKPVSGSLLTTSDNNDTSLVSETKTKVDEKDTMLSQKSGLNQINKGVIGLSLSDSKLTEEYTGPKPEDEDFCSICRDSHTNPKTLKKCSHSFCTDCIDEYFKIKPECPNCFVAYGVITGNQPEGYMSDSISKIKLPGYEQYNTIVVSYSFSDGTQTVSFVFLSKLKYILIHFCKDLRS